MALNKSIGRRGWIGTLERCGFHYREFYQLVFSNSTEKSIEKIRYRFRIVLFVIFAGNLLVIAGSTECCISQAFFTLSLFFIEF